MSGIESIITCAMCGKTIKQQKQILFETIDGHSYAFDNKDCILFFKKFKCLHGDNFNV